MSTRLTVEDPQQQPAENRERCSATTANNSDTSSVTAQALSINDLLILHRNGAGCTPRRHTVTPSVTPREAKRTRTPHHKLRSTALTRRPGQRQRREKTSDMLLRICPRASRELPRGRNQEAHYRCRTSDHVGE